MGRRSRGRGTQPVGLVVMQRGILAIALLLASIARAGGPPADVDLAAVLPPGDVAVEYWDLIGDFESGHRLFARFLITNVGPGDQTALAFGHWIAPDGTATPFKNGRRKGDWSLASNRKRLKIGSSVLDLGETQRHFEIDNDKRGIKIFIDVEADATAVASPDADAALSIDLLNLGSPARGSFWLTGMSEAKPLTGRALLTHSVASLDEGESFTRRIDFAVLDGPERWFLSHTERRGGGAPRVFAAHAAPGQAAVPLPAPSVQFTPNGASDRTYPIPGRLNLTKSASGNISLDEVQLKLDPLDALPTLLKMVYPFRRSPQHSWLTGVANVELKSETGEAVHRIEGAGLAIVVHQDSSPQ